MPCGRARPRSRKSTVSPLSPERVVAELAPSRVVVRRPRVAPQALACDAAAGPEPWRAAVVALGAARLGKCRLTVELGGAFVRYALLPWSEALVTAAEEEAYVRHHFVAVHGERARAWAVRAAEAAPGTARLAAAVDRALVEALVAAVKSQPGVKLVSIQPQLMSRFNAWRGAVPAQGAWIVLAEDGRACIALHGAQGWRSVQSERGDWRALLERARLRASTGVPQLVLLGGAAAPDGDDAWHFREMSA